MLAALIEVGHDHGDPSGLSADGSDRSLEVLVVIVRRHVVFKTKHLVGLAVIDDISKKIEIHSPHGLGDHSLTFTGSETGKVTVYDIRGALVADVGK